MTERIDMGRTATLPGQYVVCQGAANPKQRSPSTKSKEIPLLLNEQQVPLGVPLTAEEKATMLLAESMRGSIATHGIARFERASTIALILAGVRRHEQM